MRDKHPDLLDAKPPTTAVVTTARARDVVIAVVSFPLTGAPPRLTRAERAVVRGLLEGKSNRQLAYERGRSVHTIGNQIAALFKKLGVGSRLELTRLLTDVNPISRGSSSGHTARRGGSRSERCKARDR